MKPKGRDGSKGARARRKGQLLAALGLAESYVPEKPVMSKNKVRPKTITRSVWTEEQVAFLKEHYGRMPREELAQILGKTVPAISGKAGQLGLRRKKEARWTQEEVDFLENYWGNYTISALAKRLGRTENAILIKAKRIGLGPTKFSTDYMTARELADILGVDVHAITHYWIPKCGLKARRRATRKDYKFWRIRIEDFWAWAEYNQDKFDSRRFKKGDLGKEPAWMELKRKRDQLLPARQYQKWTPDEDRRLINLFKAGKSYKEIGRLLGRSASAVGHRLGRIGWKNIWESESAEKVNGWW